MNDTNKVASPRRPRSRRRSRTLLALVSACPSLVDLAAGELRPHRRHVASLIPAFVPRKGRVSHRNRGRGSTDSHRIPSHLSSVLLDLRCGGADDVNTDSGGDEDIIAERDSEDMPSQQEALVDISVVESEDSSTNIDVDGGEVNLAPSEDESESDTNIACAEDEGEEESPNEVGTSSEISQGDDDAGEESGMESVESSGDTEDVTDELTSADETAAVDDLAEVQSKLRESASNRRAEGKALHDSGSLSDAAQAFSEAASLLDEAMSMSDTELTDDAESISVERATCRLHEALCLLKDGRPGDCVEACTDVLEDGVTVVPLEADEDADEGTEEDAGEEGSAKPKPAAVVKIVPPPASAPRRSQNIPPQIRARAHHRRAKARLALGDLDGALEDARSAAFMGDRNAVQFYGRLMREGSGAAAGDASALGGLGASPFGGPSDGQATSNPFLDGVLNGMGGNGNPLMPSGAGSSDFSSSLLSSLLTSGDSSSGGGGGNPFGLMGELLAPTTEGKGKSKRRRGRKKRGGNGMDGLAKSVVANLMKRIENEETQEQICSYLRSTNTQQIMAFASMAGMPIKEDSAQRLVTLANGVTPEGISKSISRVKRGVSVVKTIRKILKVMDKYKSIIILSVLFYWIRSAITKPYPVSKKRQARELAEKAALSLLIAPSTSSSRNGSFMGTIMARKALGGLYLSSEENDMDAAPARSGIEEELERLQNQLSLIEALEERNKAQLDSFVDEEDQWQSLEEDERQLLCRKDSIVQRMEVLTEELVMVFMGQKMRDG